ncbi:uncharacterized protein M421DRAFT_290540 [Didymella exigua CBS 183.55]|uniref:Uncharacterized protein n=1 Tax=Didymella exigua CBS 183.55 TaxID=1150837 RepID=A0A6A5RV86_9PLEO|nr:uncharacterized protein M421DRAFT_290540 [Didymella exigua CBS 183.55]KAF1932371.1 hypothetical protein M421DRAFT_290540 [Didymella exigua CBS 183.55]
MVVGRSLSVPAPSSLPHSITSDTSPSHRSRNPHAAPTTCKPRPCVPRCYAPLRSCRTRLYNSTNVENSIKSLKTGTRLAFETGESHSCGAVVARRSYKTRQILMTHLGYADAVGSIPTRYVLLKKEIVPASCTNMV